MKKFAITGLLSAAMMTTVATAGVFSDVEPSHWAYKTLNTLHAQGIVKGDGTGKFKGGERITRYEAAMMVGEAIRYVSSVRAAGGTIDHETMDMISSIMTEMTDEMQVLEIRVEENSDAIAAMRKDLTMKGKCSQGATIPMGAGRLKIMGQAMFSVVAGGDSSVYSQNANVNAIGGLGTEGTTQFMADYAALGFAADIDEKTSFYTRASIYMGGQANGAGLNSLQFDDIAYIHVKDLWTGWDMNLGRIALPFGHETAGMFRTNPYFVSNSMVDSLYGLIDGAYFSSENKDGEFYYGFGLHNGNVMATPEGNWNHVYPFVNAAGKTFGVFGAAGTFAPAPNATANTNENDDFGFVAHVGSQAQNGDLKWDLGYFTNGAGLNADPAAVVAPAGFAEMDFFTIGVDYRINEDWHVTAEYVDGSIENNIGALVTEDDFTVWYAQLIYNLDAKSTLALRYGISEYDPQVAAGAVTVQNELTDLTFAYARKLSDNGTMIIEYSKPEVDKLNGVTPVLAANQSDDFEVIRASYRIDF